MLKGQLTHQDIRRQYAEYGVVMGSIEVPLNEIVGLSHREFLEMLSSKLVGSRYLTDLRYHVKSVVNEEYNVLELAVTGNPEMLLGSEED